jgi:hypothetical protein
MQKRQPSQLMTPPLLGEVLHFGDGLAHQIGYIAVGFWIDWAVAKDASGDQRKRTKRITFCRQNILQMF